MTIVFFSNFLNHHQLPLCKEFIKLVGEDNFHFVATERIHEERVKMGYENMNIKYSFVVRAYESYEQKNYAIKLAHESDVAIIGSAPLEYSEIRGACNKLTFLYRERLFKYGTWRRFYPPTALRIYKEYLRYKNKNFYVLCASAYTADDLELCGFPRKKCLKWGYFPEMTPKVEKNYDKLRIMWCGRMLWWKHPEDAVHIAHILDLKNIDFEMIMVGNGEKRKNVEDLINRYRLHSRVRLFDFMPPADIRSQMEKANLYLFTSGKQEGWGVVLNEALNSGCAVVANMEAGSTPYLVKDMYNGVIYDKSYKELTNAVERLIAVPISQISTNAYEVISDVWNPRTAVYNLIQFINNHNHVPLNGPCSYA